MIWLLPAAWIGALAIAAPIVIHLIARPRASMQPFPTLRFLPAATQAALRRRRMSELPLLLVRCAIVILSAAALAGPLALTRGRRADWNARVDRETVDESSGALRDGLVRAVAKLSDAPPGRPEIVVRSAFPIGSITDADVAAVPSSIGLTFERSASLPATREAAAPPVLVGDRQVARGLFVDGPRTGVSDRGTAPASAPIDLVAPDAAGSALDAVLAERVAVAPPGRRARLIVAGTSAFAQEARAARPVRVAWIADAIARIASDVELTSAARQIADALTESSFSREPWHVVARNRDGTAFAAAASDADGRLLVASAAAGDRLALALLIRSMLNALAPPASFADAEVVSISDARLRAWSRPPGPAADPRINTIDQDDRRVLWVAVLLLLGIETWIRRNDR